LLTLGALEAVEKWLDPARPRKAEVEA
jgi:hypothetical protein